MHAKSHGVVIIVMSATSFFRALKKDAEPVYNYENYKGIAWFCVGYVAAILMSFMNIWWK